MKKFSAQLLTILLLTFMVSCSSTSATTSTPTSGGIGNSAQPVDDIATGQFHNDIDFDDTHYGDEPSDLGLARCEAILPSCGWGWDSTIDGWVDLWEISQDGNEWVIKERYKAQPIARCEGLVEACGYRYDEETGDVYDFWIFDYGTGNFIDETFTNSGQVCTDTYNSEDSCDYEITK